MPPDASYANGLDSWQGLDAADACRNRYRVAARTSNTPDSTTGNAGFRCAADA
ncbi:hypothetical protein [Actinomadura coerulea]|uniref:hypothetical protein n=1 Tax=Actinomadura coerulea TaxID=46159 RepID=UPI00342CEF5E